VSHPPILSLKALSTTFATPDGPLEAVHAVDFSIGPGEIVGVVGESGCGKSVTFLSALSLLPAAARVSGEVWLGDQDLLQVDDRARSALLRQEVGVIFQEPVATLDPVFSIGYQLGEVLAAHGQSSASARYEQSVNLLRDAGIPVPRERLHQYPFQLSGGLCQRVGIALAFANRPRLIVADEPTTALDVTVQAQILRLLVNLVRQHEAALVLISHDLAVIAQIADRVVVMYAGTVVEEGPVREIFHHPAHPYTQRLLAALPRLGAEDQELESIPGTVPSHYDRLPGCRFAPRCPHAQNRCTTALPPLFAVTPVHRARCVLAE
jgi:peptide/nickel transport system ATP-binding protein